MSLSPAVDPTPSLQGAANFSRRKIFDLWGDGGPSEGSQRF